MKKKLLTTFGIIAALLLVAVLVVSFFLGSIIKAGVNKFGPAITKTKVELAGATLSPLTGEGSISGLFIGNPPGWRSDKAVYLGRVELSVVPTSLFGDHIVIKRLIIDQPEFVYETKIFSSNLRDLLKNIQASTGSGDEAAAPVQTRSGKPLRIEVRQFVLRQGKVTIGVGEDAVTVPMPELTLSDLGTGQGGLTANQMAGVILGHILDHVLVTTAGALTGVGKTSGAAATNAAANAAQKAADELKKLFGK